MMNLWELQQEAIRIIGEDRVPVETLQEIVDQWAPHSRHAETVRIVTENIARLHGVGIERIEEDHNDPPGSTSDYEGRALAYCFAVGGRELRILVEDVTVDGEEPDA